MKRVERAEKAAEQLERNREHVDAIRAAETLLGRVQANIAERQAALADAKAEMQRTALDMADGKEVDAPAALAKVDAAQAALSLAEAALPAAQARLEQARIDARKNRLQADIALVNKFGRKRIEAANQITAAIEALDAAFVQFHVASRSLAASYAAKMPPGCLIGADIATAVSAEMFRIAPRQFLGGGGREPIPTLPGAMINRLYPSRTLREGWRARIRIWLPSWRKAYSPAPRAPRTARSRSINSFCRRTIGALAFSARRSAPPIPASRFQTPACPSRKDR